MTTQTLAQSIEAAMIIIAEEQGRDILEVITQARAGAAIEKDEATLEILCEIKNKFIEI